MFYTIIYTVYTYLHSQFYLEDTTNTYNTENDNILSQTYIM